MSHLLRKAALSAIGGSLLVATLGLAPATAEQPDAPPGQAQAAQHAPATPNGHADDHGQPVDHGKPADRHDPASDHDGDADSDASTSYTEDTDTNDGGTRNNVADEGDNRHPSGRDRSVEQGGSGNQGRSESDPDDNDRGPERTNGGADKPNGPGGDDLADQDGNNGCGNDDDFEDDNEGWCGKPADTEPEVKPESQSDSTPEDKPTKPVNRGTTRTAADSTDAPEKPETPAAVIDAVNAAGGPATAECPDAAHAAAGDMPAGCEVAATGDDEDDERGNTEVLGAESSRGEAAVAETPARTVSARSAGGALLASLANVPVLGSVIEGQLPMTGSGIITFLIVAMAAMVIGFLLVRASRRTKVDATS